MTSFAVYSLLGLKLYNCDLVTLLVLAQGFHMGRHVRHLVLPHPHDDVTFLQQAVALGGVPRRQFSDFGDGQPTTVHLGEQPGEKVLRATESALCEEDVVLRFTELHLLLAACVV